jgi:tRNA(His) 5'-end guanylyltransferase
MNSLGDRMKEYENTSKLYLTRRCPYIIRIDGRAFHSFTKKFKRPYDDIFNKTMWETAKYLCENITGCKLAYVQSDEISLLLTDYDKIGTEPWFNKGVQKIVSISASLATLAFNNKFREISCDKEPYISKYNMATFDSRVFVIPKEEACNYFIWRQRDATRNYILSIGQANFSHKELHGKSCNDIQEVLFTERQINFNDFPTSQKRGVSIIKEMFEKDGTIRSKWNYDLDVPIFTENREYIENLL